MGVRSDSTASPSLCDHHSRPDAAPQWFRNHGYLYNGKYTDLNDWIKADWEGGFVGLWDANDMMVLMRTWWKGDVSRLGNVAPGLQGDLASVLGGITSKGLIMPSKTDLYFPVRAYSSDSGRTC